MKSSTVGACIFQDENILPQGRDNFSSKNIYELNDTEKVKESKSLKSSQNISKTGHFFLD